LAAVARLEGAADILKWIGEQSGDAHTVVLGVDAPLVIRSQTGIRPAERLLNADFRRFHAGCHPANLGRPFAANVLAFSRALEEMGFAHGPDMAPRQHGRSRIEVHPHSASVNLFDLQRIVKYKRGKREARARELRRLRGLIARRLPDLGGTVELPGLPSIPRVGNLKPAEDRIDAVLCAYIAAHWWYWGRERNVVYGTRDEGYLVVPQRYLDQRVTRAEARPSGQRA
jgi:predicted RNase H-like nuclease